MGTSGERDLDRKLAELPSQEPWERAAVLMELGWSRVGQSTPGIRPFLDDGAPVVRIAAAQALWQTDRADEELERLVEVLVEGLCLDDEDLSLMAGTALVQMESAVVEPLVRQFRERGGKDPLIVRVLGEIADEDVSRFLVEASRSGIAEVAHEAKEALAAIDAS